MNRSLFEWKSCEKCTFSYPKNYRLRRRLDSFPSICHLTVFLIGKCHRVRTKARPIQKNLGPEGGRDYRGMVLEVRRARENFCPNIPLGSGEYSLRASKILWPGLHEITLLATMQFLSAKPCLHMNFNFSILY